MNEYLSLTLELHQGDQIMIAAYRNTLLSITKFPIHLLRVGHTKLDLSM